MLTEPRHGDGTARDLYGVVVAPSLTDRPFRPRLSRADSLSFTSALTAHLRSDSRTLAIGSRVWPSSRKTPATENATVAAVPSTQPDGGSGRPARVPETSKLSTTARGVNWRIAQAVTQSSAGAATHASTESSRLRWVSLRVEFRGLLHVVQATRNRIQHPRRDGLQASHLLQKPAF